MSIGYKSDDKEQFVQYMRKWKTQSIYYVVAFGYSLLLFIIMGIPSILVLIKTATQGVERIYFILALLGFTFSLLLMLYCGNLMRKSPSVQVKIFGYSKADQPMLIKKLDSILDDMKLKYIKKGPSGYFDKTTERYEIRGFKMEIMWMKSDRGPHWQGTKIFITENEQEESTIKSLIDVLDSELEEFNP